MKVRGFERSAERSGGNLHSIFGDSAWTSAGGCLTSDSVPHCSSFFMRRFLVFLFLESFFRAKQKRPAEEQTSTED